MPKKSNPKTTGKRYNSVDMLVTSQCSKKVQDLYRQGEPCEPLPLIKIKRMRDVEYSQIDLDMDDEAFKLIAEYGRKVATDENFFEIGFLVALKNSFPPKRKKK